MIVNVGIVEDDRAICENIGALIHGQRNFNVAFTSFTAEQALTQISESKSKLDVAIIDLGLPGMNGIELIKILNQNYPHVDSIVFTVFDDDKNLFNALRAGAVGYFTKDTSPDSLLDAIDDIRNGGAPMSPGIARRVVQTFSGMKSKTRTPKKHHPLTGREEQILQSLAQGYTYLNISAQLSISEHTVHAHIRNIYKKLSVSSRSEAVYEGLRRRIVRL